MCSCMDIVDKDQANNEQHVIDKQSIHTAEFHHVEEDGEEGDDKDLSNESEEDDIQDSENVSSGSRYPKSCRKIKSPTVIDFDNKTYLEWDGSFHINPATPDTYKEELRWIPTTKSDKGLQDELSKANLDDNIVMYIVGVIMAQQFSLQQGMKFFGKKGKEAAMSKLTQLHDMQTYHPVRAHELTRQQRIDALSSLIFLMQKRDGRVKGQTCVNGSKQRR